MDMQTVNEKFAEMQAQHQGGNIVMMRLLAELERGQLAPNPVGESNSESKQTRAPHRNKPKSKK